MSQYFQIGSRELWNPATGVAQVFVLLADAFAAGVGTATGIGPVVADEYEIDLPVFAAFVDGLIAENEMTNNSIRRSLVDGFIATAMVLVERGGGSLPALEVSRKAGYWRKQRDDHARLM